MKQLFICATLIACSVFAYAQEKTSPSFRNYLNDKGSLPLYKPRVSNTPGKSDIHLKIDELKKFLDKEKARPASFPGSFAGLLPNGNKLFLLPQDNMPCVVPDQSAFNMPVAKGNIGLDKMINGSNP